MRTSEQINEIAAALAKAQGEIKNPTKNKVNPHFRSNYTDLAGGLDIVRPTLSKHGISVVQMPNFDGDMVTLHTRIMHTSGQWLESTYPICRTTKHQEMGSAMTYARRYALFAMIGVAGEDDDDDGNNSATARGRPVAKNDPRPPANEPAPPPPPPGRQSSAQLKRDDVWTPFERDIRAAATSDALNAAWKKYSEDMERWPKAWQDEADEEFLSQLDAINASQQAAE